MKRTVAWDVSSPRTFYCFVAVTLVGALETGASYKMQLLEFLFRSEHGKRSSELGIYFYV